MLYLTCAFSNDREIIINDFWDQVKVGIMGKFRTDLVARILNEREWQLAEPLVYESDTVGVIIVPKGFVTNFGSVPRLPFMYMFFGGVGNRACTLHDWLYAPPHEPFTGCGVSVDRKTADKVLRGVIRECMQDSWPIIKSSTAWAMWAGVRIGGSSHWVD